MSDPEGFLQRWSRRKRAAAAREVPEQDAAAPEVAMPGPDGPAGDGASLTPVAPPEAPAAPPVPPAIDIESLPALESITAETDVTGFLARGVPPDLTRAALRRAWMADPQIRGFIGIAENQWDFTAPDGLHGFGPLGDEEARGLVEEIMRRTAALPADAAPESAVFRPPPEAAPAPPVNRDESHPAVDEHQATIPAAEASSDAALQHEEPAANTLATRRKSRHGSALPD